MAAAQELALLLGHLEAQLDEQLEWVGRARGLAVAMETEPSIAERLQAEFTAFVASNAAVHGIADECIRLLAGRAGRHT